MRKIFLSFSAALLSMVILSSPASARDLIVGVTPHAASPDEARQNTVRLIRFVIEELQPGEIARIIDAESISSICDFSLPDRAAYRHEKAKVAQNAPCISKLLKRAENAKQSAPEPYVVRLPDFLRFVGGNYPVTQETDVLIFGSPLFDDPREPSVSMAYGHVPGDGHLNASESASPYSATSSALLSHLRVHIVAPDASWAINREHDYFVRRLWTLFIQNQGGSLVSFTSDPQTAFTRIQSNAVARKGEFQLADTAKLEMIPIRRDTGKRTPIHQRSIAQTPPSAMELRSASNVEIGITWDCVHCDLDLYARPWRGAEVLFWNHTNSPEGQFFKDFRHSPDIANGLETIEFIVPLDLEKLFLAVNLYEGAPPSGLVSGEIRIAIGERTWAAPFSLASETGTMTKGAAELFGGAPSQPGWVVIDTRKTLGLSQ